MLEVSLEEELPQLVRIGKVNKVYKGLIVKRYLGSAGVAQLARALPCQGRGRGFESLRPLHFHLFYG